jgi:hypothetical protein
LSEKNLWRQKFWRSCEATRCASRSSSNYPFPLGETNPGQLIESMKFSVKEKAQLLSGTAREFLQLKDL